MNETPIATTDGLSGRRDRMWGWIGGALGAAVGLGSAAIAIFVEGATAYQSSPYPPFFTKRQILAYDAFLGVVVVAGAAFGIGGDGPGPAQSISSDRRAWRGARRHDPDASRVGPSFYALDRGRPRSVTCGPTPSAVGSMDAQPHR